MTHHTPDTYRPRHRAPAAYLDAPASFYPKHAGKRADRTGETR